MSERIVNVPNAITLLRLLAAPAVVWLVLHAQWQAACWVFLVAALSDGLDGYLARRLGQTTADKALGLGTLVTLTRMDTIPLWVTLAILLRDTVIVLGAFRYQHRMGHLEIQPTGLGKTHTFVEFALLVLVLADMAKIIRLGIWQWPLFAGVFAIAVISGIQYVWIWSGKARREEPRPTR
jgi:cardiolipin synthase